MRFGKHSLKNAKIIGKILLIVLLLFCVLLSGFSMPERDTLYYFQWGLKNKGNLMIDKGVLAENHNILFHSEAFANSVFLNDSSEVEYIKKTINNPGIAYGNEDIDIKWENAYKVFESIKDKRDVVVAIIDSGVDINHFELADNIWVNKREIPYNGIDDDGNGYIDDVNGYNFYDKNANVFVDGGIDIHGTHAAGTIVAKHDNGGIKGIAYDSHVKIMPLKILGENGKGTMSSLVEAISYARTNGANICNISLGAYTYDSMLDNAIKSNPDMIFVVAAGNGAGFIGYSLDERNVYPAKLDYDNVITVSNVCFDGERYVSANYGSYVTLFAPGTFILSTAPGDNFGYFTGTSMAAPFVSGACAMIYSAYKNVPISKYKNILIESATLTSEIVGYSKSGILNIENALRKASAF